MVGEEEKRNFIFLVKLRFKNKKHLESFMHTWEKKTCIT